MKSRIANYREGGGKILFRGQTSRRYRFLCIIPGGREATLIRFSKSKKQKNIPLSTSSLQRLAQIIDKQLVFYSFIAKWLF